MDTSYARSAALTRCLCCPGEQGRQSQAPPPARAGAPAKEYHFQLDPFQQTAINCLEFGALTKYHCYANGAKAQGRGEMVHELFSYQAEAAAVGWVAHAGHSVLVSAHTSAGKTVVAEYAFAMALRQVVMPLITEGLVILRGSFVTSPCSVPFPVPNAAIQCGIRLQDRNAYT